MYCQQAKPRNTEAEREKVKSFKIHCPILCISEILITLGRILRLSYFKKGQSANESFLLFLFVCFYFLIKREALMSWLYLINFSVEKK